MKKKLAALMLCACILLPSGLAMAAAGPWDPLISLSYLQNFFLPEARQSILSQRTVLSHQFAQPSLITLTMMPGQRLSLTAGQQFTLLSGAAQLTANTGSAVDVTEGVLSGSGPAKPSTRYILCEDAGFTVGFPEKSLVTVSAGAVSGVVRGFQDVDARDWFYRDLTVACFRGLVNGVTTVTYEPRSTLTVAQCIKLCACMHQLWHEGNVTLENSPGEAWYTSFADYAVSRGILRREYEDYNAVISRVDYIEMFYRALPEESYVPINEIPYGAIPDVGGSEDFGETVYTMYRAGILNGYPADAYHSAHAFDAPSSITRAEVAAILNRMFDETARLRFSI